jgi:hypothetical protein
MSRLRKKMDFEDGEGQSECQQNKNISSQAIHFEPSVETFCVAVA